jgi:CRISPR-associated protein Csm2
MNTPSPQRPSEKKVIGSSADRESRGTIIDRIKKLDRFGDYNIRELVTDAEEIGRRLKDGKLETNQVRKFLDAINRIKAELLDEVGSEDKDDARFKKIEVDIVLLKPKLAYAAARQAAAKPLQEVLDVAIDRVESMNDFKRLVQFVESIVAYHKAAGGK